MPRLACLLVLLAASLPGPARAVAPADLPAERDWQLGGLDFAGNAAVGTRTLRAVMVTRERPWFTPWRPRPAFDPVAFTNDLERVRRFYVSRGYYDALVTGDLAPREQEGIVVALVSVEEGQPVVIEEIDVQLEAALPAGERDRLLAGLPLAPGQVFTQEAYDRGLAHLRRYYREHGYARVEVTKRARVDRERRAAAVAYHADPGPASVFGEPRVAATGVVDPAVVRREIAFVPGEPFRQSLLDRTVDNLAALNLYTAIHLEESPGPDPRVDVTANVTEAPSHEIRLGAGYDTEEQVRGLVSWRDYDFGGGARQLGFTARASILRQALTADFLQPHFPLHDSRTRLLLVEQREEEDAYTLDRSRLSPRLEWQPRFPLTAYVFYRVEYDSLSDVPDAVEAALPGVAPANSVLSGLGVGADWNATDKPVDPTRGWVASATVEPIGGVLGGDVALVRAVGEGRVYRPLVGRFLGAARLRLGVAEPVAGAEEVPLFERLYAGGINSVRGYGRRRVGPLVDDDPVGGRTSIEAALELRHPLTETLTGVVFLDAGQVSLESFDFPFGDLRYGTGLGIRVRSPIGPLHLDLGFPLQPEGDRRWQVYVSVGEPSRMRRLRRLALAAVVFILVTALALWTASRTTRVQELVRARVEALLQTSFTGEVRLGRIDGTLGRRLVVHDLRISIGGRSVVRVPRVEIVYSPLALLFRRLSLSRVTLIAPWVRVVQDAAGWRLPRLATAGGPALALGVRIRRLEVVDGRVSIARPAGTPHQFAATAIRGEATLAIEGDRQRLRIRALRFVPRGVAVSPVRATGEVATLGGGRMRVRDLDLATTHSHVVASGTVDSGALVEARLGLLPLDHREVRALWPAAALRTDVHAAVDAAGPWHALVVGVRAGLGPAGTLRAETTLDLAAKPFAYEAKARFADLDPAAAWDGLAAARATGTVRARGRGAGREAPIGYRVAFTSLAVAGRSLGPATLGGRGVRGVHRLTGSVVDPAGVVRLHGRVRLADPITYRAAARVAVTHLEALAPTLTGHGGGHLTVVGAGTDAASRRATMHARLAPGVVGGLPIAGGEVRAELVGQRLQTTTAVLQGAGVGARGAGTLDLARGTIEATLQGRGDLVALGTGLAGAATADLSARGPLAGPTVTARLAAPGARLGEGTPHDLAATLEWRPAPDADWLEVAATAGRAGTTLHRVALTLRRAPSGTTGRLKTLVLTPPEGPPWTLVRPADLALGDGLATSGIVLGVGRQRLALAGRLGWRGANSATVDAEALRVATLCALAGAPACAGRLSGRVTIGGTGIAPVLEATATATDLRVEDVPYGDLTLEARAAEGRALVHATLRHPSAGSLRVDGTVPVDLAWAPHPAPARTALDLRVVADRLDVAIFRTLAPAHVRRLAGSLTVDLRLTGSRAAPRAEGTIVLADGRLELVATRVVWEDVRARLVAAGAMLEVAELYARGGDGTVEARGGIDLATGGLGLHATLREFAAVRQPAYEAALSGTLDVGGTLDSPDVRGQLEMTHAVLRPAALPASGPSMEHDPTITITGGPEQSVGLEPPPGPALGETARLAIDVRFAQHAWIRRPDAEIQLDGAVRVAKEPRAPVRLTGAIILRRGWYAFQGRRFVIEEGTIWFSGDAPPRPIFHVTASYQTAGYRIVVHVGGAGERPTLMLSSDPPLSQADVLAVLLFGRPTPELGRRDAIDLQQEAISLSSDYSAPGLRTSVLNSLGLHAFGVEGSAGGSDGGRVTVGRYVRSDVFVSLAHEFGARAGEVVGLEYYLTRRFSVKATTSTRGNAGVDAFWNLRY